MSGSSMKPIESQDLVNVRGGFGALLGAALQAAPGILNGVAGIIGASKSGGGAGAAPQSAPAPSPAAAAVPSAPALMAPPSSDGGVSIKTNVSITR